MTRATLTMLLSGAALACALLSPSPTQAQWPIGLGGGEIDRQFRPGAYVSYDGAGFMHRVNYEVGPALFLGYDGRLLAHLNYLDQLDRQQCLGHLWPSAKRGPVYQIERIERDYLSHWACPCVGCFPW